MLWIVAMVLLISGFMAWWMPGRDPLLMVVKGVIALRAVLIAAFEVAHEGLGEWWGRLPEKIEAGRREVLETK
jgi:hypothetical protein